MIRRRPVLVSLGLVAAAGAARAAAVPRILVPRRPPVHPEAGRYLMDVLALAVERCGYAYRLEESAEFMGQARSMIDMLAPNGGVDLMWSMTDQEREDKLLPVRIPLDLGLIGYRLPMVRANDLERWQSVRELAQLRPLVAGQGHDWPDVQILRSNGLSVSTSSRYDTLFDMLRAGRIDYFPRSVLEIDDEMKSPLAKGLVIEPRLLLHYVAASYLFVRPDRPELAADLQRGLEAASQDGSFQRLFMAYHAPMIERHRLKQRVVISLDNPTLPRLTPLDRKPLWWAPS